MSTKKFRENHLARVLAIQYLFQYLQNKKESRDTIFFEPESILAELFDTESLKFNRDLYTNLVEATIEHFDEINIEISKVAIERPVEEIDLLTRISVALAVVEVRIIKNVPPKVAIDEAIEIDKELNNGEMFKLINAVLGKVFNLDK